MSKFDQITTFIDVVEEKGFAAAARKKTISVAAISKQIMLLERSLGIQLLSRSTRHVALTEIGQEYYQQCKKTLRELQSAEEAIASSKREATGTLRIMANRYFVMTHILPTLKKFMVLNPGVRIHFELAEKVPNFEKDNIDILFGVSIEGANELVRRRVATTRYVLCASPTYLKKYGTPKTPQDLLNHHYIAHGSRKPDNVILMQHKEVLVNPVLWLNDSYALRECALQHMGLVNLHDYIVADALSEKKLVEVLAKYQEPQKNIYLYYQQKRYLQPKIRRFIDFYVS